MVTLQLQEQVLRQEMGSHHGAESDDGIIWILHGGKKQTSMCCEGCHHQLAQRNLILQKWSAGTLGELPPANCSQTLQEILIRSLQGQDLLATHSLEQFITAFLPTER